MDARSTGTTATLGGLIGLLVAGIPVALNGGLGTGYDELIAVALVVGPILGVLHAHEVRADRFRLGLLARMAILAVVLGDAIFVGILAAESTSSDGIVGGIILIFVLGLFTVGLAMLLITVACAAVWQVLMRFVLQVMESRTFTTRLAEIER